MTLGMDLFVPGDYRPVPPPEPTCLASVDGYTVALDGGLTPGDPSRLRFSVYRDGAPVTDLDPYLGAYGHLVALPVGDLAYLHVHPERGARGQSDRARSGRHLLRDRTQLGGKLADISLGRALVGTVGALAAVLFAMTWLIENQVTAVIGILAYGVAAFAVAAPLQLRVMAKAGDAPDVASAANISAFTLGSALGIWLGGAAIDGGLGITSVNLIGGIIAAAGVLLAMLSLRLDRREATPVDLETAKSLAHHH